MKTLKRLFAYLRISETDPALQQELVSFFNSSVGELSSYKSDLELISIMLEQSFRPVKRKDIIYNLKYIEKHISPNFKDLVKSILKMKTMKQIKEHTQQTGEILNNDIQNNTKTYIKSNKKLYSFVKV
jgi:hypothetical protein